jgi:hypothetical protein
LRHRFYQWIDLSLPSRLISRQLRYELDLIELAPEHGEVEIAGVRVTPFEVNHFGSDVGAPPLALRLQINGQVLAYTGDTDWIASLEISDFGDARSDAARYELTHAVNMSAVWVKADTIEEPCVGF